jgi:hypothetical protein
MPWGLEFIIKNKMNLLDVIILSKLCIMKREV